MSSTPTAVQLTELPSLCTLREAATALRTSARTVQRFIAAGRLRAARFDSGSSRVLVPRVELERFVSESMQ